MIQTLVLGPVTIHVYGFILGVAVVVGWWEADRLATAGGIGKREIDRLIWWTLGGGVIGARFYHVVDYWEYYQTHVAEVAAVWNGGLGIWGAVIGGVMGMMLAQLSMKRRGLMFFDIAAVVLPLSQAIGRWGNYVNYELFGKPTNLPWKIFIPESYRPLGLESAAYYHPLFLYESLLLLWLFVFLRIRLKGGLVLGSGYFWGSYLIGYGLIRFGLEPLRIYAWQFGGLFVAQWVSLVAIGIGLLMFKNRIKRIK